MKQFIDPEEVERYRARRSALWIVGFVLIVVGIFFMVVETEVLDFMLHVS